MENHRETAGEKEAPRGEGHRETCATCESIMSARAVSLVSMGPFVSNVKLGGKFNKKVHAWSS